MTFVFRAVVLALGVTGMIHSINIAAAPDYSADVARAMRSGDYAQARTLLRERAQAGDAEAQLNLGALLATGRGGRPDPAQAARWYRKAAEQGNASAQYNLGTLYAQGTGVTRDMSQAVHWWRKAAEQGVIAAQYNMGAASADGVASIKATRPRSTGLPTLRLPETIAPAPHWTISPQGCPPSRSRAAMSGCAVRRARPPKSSAGSASRRACRFWGARATAGPWSIYPNSNASAGSRIACSAPRRPHHKPLTYRFLGATCAASPMACS